jgi:succinyl-diaminopimelate desuccinylase
MQDVIDRAGEPLKLTVDAGVGEQAALTDLCMQVMRVYSVSDDETHLTDMTEAFLRTLPHLDVQRHGDTLVARTNLGRDRRVVLAGHLDVVPVIDNFPPKLLEPGDPLILPGVAEAHPGERVVWGRGATDMKSSDAVLLYLAATLTNPKYDLTYVFYDHEEVAAEKNGLRKVAEAHPDWIAGDFAIIGEPTSCGIEGGCNGTIRFDVVTHGIAAHSARAWMGHNAIHDAAEILRRLNEHTDATVSVDGLDLPRRAERDADFSGGKGTNVIPDECRVHVNYRFAPDKIARRGEGADDGRGLRCRARQRRAPGDGRRVRGLRHRDEGRIAVGTTGHGFANSRARWRLCAKARTGKDPAGEARLDRRRAILAAGCSGRELRRRFARCSRTSTTSRWRKAIWRSWPACWRTG